MNSVRVGHGYDVHRLVPGRDLIIGGVAIPYEKGLLGHSDADVLLHAVCEALLGAAALGDIGKHFPDRDARYKDINSRELLRKVRELLDQAGFSVVNVDTTVIAQAPRLAPYIPEMVVNIARDLALPETSVSVKARTNEGLGEIGRGVGIAAHAVASIAKA
ncbi:MAG: 2-C-methyl-D-erythritol 2,4-cyclodiphosphate synthase [Burkholderiales bacterium]